MKTTINERLQFVINEIFNRNTSEFCRITGIPQPTMNSIVGNRKSKPSSDILEKTVNAIANLNSSWLLTGEGEMLNPDPESVIYNDSKLEKELTEYKEKYLEKLEKESALRDEIDRLKHEIEYLKRGYGKRDAG